MGISIGSALVVGLPYKDMFFVYMEDQSPAEDVDFYDWLDDKDMSRFSPYFDAPRTDCLFGFRVAGCYYTHTEVEEDYVDSINTYSGIFYKLTGLKPKLYVTADVT